MTQPEQSQNEERAERTTQESQAPPESAEPMQEQLQAELEEVRREKDQYRSIAQRAQADLVNFKRRTEEERDELQRRVTERVVTKLLDITDDFERALAHVPAEDNQASWVQGIGLIYQKLWSLLEVEGVSRVEALHQPFDPWEHEALYHEETDQFPEGHVVQVIRPGYRLGGTVIRPAQVAVARQTNSEGPQAQEGREA